jgi:hypothetical protein
MTSSTSSSAASPAERPTGAGPTPERFQQAVQSLESRGEKVTRRAVHQISGGTMSVVNLMCRELEQQKAAALSAYKLPAEFDVHLKNLIVLERDKAIKDVASQLANKQADVLEMEAQVEDLENRLAATEFVRDQQCILRLTAEAVTATEKQAHAVTQGKLEASREDADKCRQEASRVTGELQGLLEALNAREHDHRQMIEKHDRLVVVLEQLVKANPNPAQATTQGTSGEQCEARRDPPPLPQQQIVKTYPAVRGEEAVEIEISTSILDAFLEDDMPAIDNDIPF